MNSTRLESLFERTKLGIKPGLEVMQELVSALDHPEKSFLCVHIAGTNGKGSVSAMVESVMREAGFKTGLFTSPHLVRVNERIRIQGEPISDSELYRGLDQIEAVENRLDRLPTFFETLTALAFLAFRDSGVQVAILETGLGGRMDSTNVVEPLVTGITRIDMDHQKFLGNTLPEIAFEKAGILKPARPAVFGAQSPEALEVLTSRAEELECPVWKSTDRINISGRKSSLEEQTVTLSSSDQDFGRVHLPLLGEYQLENLATAVCLCEAIFEELNLELDPQVMKSGLKKTVWSGRGQVLSLSPPILMDVAHNPGGARALKILLEDIFGKTSKGIWIWTSLADKDPELFLRILQPHISEVICVELESPRAMKGDALLEVAKGMGCSAVQMTLAEAKRALPSLAASCDFGCVAGSVHLAGEWMSDPSPDPGESLH